MTTTSSPADHDLVIAGGKVVLADQVIRADIGVREGKIAAVGAGLVGRTRVEARGLHVLPGLIDSHVHLREPGHPHRENFGSGTRSAAAGGITTLLEMPSGIPAVSSAESLRDKRNLVARRAVVDFGLYGGAGIANLDRIEEQADAGAIAFKSFMNAPAPNADPGTDTRCLPDDGSFLMAMRRVARTGRVAVIHAENDAICGCLARQAQAEGRRDAISHARSRPPVAEAEAVSRAIRLAADAGARVSIAHVSTAGAVAVIRRAKSECLAVTAEACPHHLVLTEDELARVGPYGKINPPLRSAADRDAVWAALLDGTIDFIGTDHAPYTSQDKDPGWSDIWRAPSGTHGLETALSLLLTEVDRGRLTLPRIATAFSRRAAEVFGLAGKGELRVGNDADLCLVDLDTTYRVDRDVLQSVSRDAARLWDGRELTGRVVATYLRGAQIYRMGGGPDDPRSGQVFGPEGGGRWLT